MRTSRCYILTFLAIGLAILSIGNAEPPPPNSVQMTIINHAGRPLELYWIHVETRKLEIQTEKPIRNSTEKVINSYNGHEFSVHFKNPPSREGNKGVQFTKGPKEEKIIITYDEHSGQMKVTQTTTVHETIDKIGAAVERCRLNKLEEKSADCMAEVILAEMADIKQATDTMKKYRDIMTSHVERYACMDGQLNVTEPEKSITVKPDPRSPESFKMDTVVDMPHAKIWRYKKFLQDGECALIDSMEVPTEAPATAEVGIDGEVSRVNSADHSDKLRPIYNGFSTTVDALAIPLVYNRLVSLLNRFVPNYKIVMHEQMKLSLFQYNTSAAVTETATIDWSRFEQNPLADNFNPVLDASGKGKSINCILVTQAAAAASGGGTLLFPNVDVALRPEKGDAICYYEAYTVPSLESITVEEQLSQKLAASHGYTPQDVPLD